MGRADVDVPPYLLTHQKLNGQGAIDLVLKLLHRQAALLHERLELGAIAVRLGLREAVQTQLHQIGRKLHPKRLELGIDQLLLHNADGRMVPQCSQCLLQFLAPQLRAERVLQPLALLVHLKRSDHLVLNSGNHAVSGLRPRRCATHQNHDGDQQKHAHGRFLTAAVWA